MSQSPFRPSLQYIPPSLGRAVIRDKSGIPGLVKLHVSPSACGRRMTISAYREHTKDRLVHLYIDEEDIISGCYEDLIPDAVEELLSVRQPRPRAIQVQVTCIDDLLGTDHAALRTLLEERFPDVRFCITRIDPIVLDGGQPPAYEMMKQLYSLLSPTDRRDDAVNLICGDGAFTRKSEVFDVLEQMGMEVRLIYDCRTFDEFLNMASSRLNLVTAVPGEKAAASMAETLGIPWVYAPTSHRLEDIRQTYTDTAAALGRPLPDLTPYEEAVQKKIDRTLARLDGMPVVVDRSASMRPLVLARALLEYGFNVKMAFDGIVLSCDLPTLEWFRNQHPEITVGDARRFDMRELRNDLGPCMAIGPSLGYLMDAPHVVEPSEPWATYGYHAVGLLMDKMFRAADTKADYDRIRAASEVWQPVECQRERCGR